VDNSISFDLDNLPSGTGEEELKETLAAAVIAAANGAIQASDIQTVELLEKLNAAAQAAADSAAEAQSAANASSLVEAEAAAVQVAAENAAKKAARKVAKLEALIAAMIAASDGA
jgi:hypothetical protein